VTESKSSGRLKRTSTTYAGGSQESIAANAWATGQIGADALPYQLLTDPHPAHKIDLRTVGGDAVRECWGRGPA